VLTVLLSSSLSDADESALRDVRALRIRGICLLQLSEAGEADDEWLAEG
jgi:hypothetical protein